jgi:hypothetical protein
MNNEEYNKELRKVWRPNWLSSINELTSLELQRKSWFDKNAPSPHWEFGEFMCSYFDDLAIDNNYADPIQRGLISQNELDIIKRWHIQLNEYDSTKNNDDVINDPEWLKIIDLGVSMKMELAETLNNQEKTILLEDINYQMYK